VTALIGSELIVLDSSGWLEYLTSDEKQESFAPYLESNLTIIIPTVVLYEVRKALLLRQDKSAADVFFSEALKHIILPFDEALAIFAVELSLRHKLPMADAIIYATAQQHHAQLVTSDNHFSGLPDVVLL
jgi:predicted nucleic acid-binding protein